MTQTYFQDQVTFLFSAETKVCSRLTTSTTDKKNHNM